MNNPDDILGISSDSTMEQIETAFQEKSEYWRRLQSNSQRSAEAKAMLDQVIAAYDFLRTQAQSTASGLEYREPQSFSGQTGVAPVDKDSCPQCGHKGNPPDARFCLNCRGQLYQLCPNCEATLPWHYQNCHQCGANIEQIHEEKAHQQRLQEIQLYRERERQLESISKQIVSLAAAESRILSMGFEDILLYAFGKRPEVRQWRRKANVGCGTRLAFLALGIIALTILSQLGIILERTFGFISHCIWFPLFLTLAGGMAYLIVDRPGALEAISQERMKLEHEKRELLRDPKQ